MGGGRCRPAALAGALAAGWLAAGCEDRGRAVAPTLPPPPSAPTLTLVQSEIFTPYCTGCHLPGGEAGLDLTAGAAYGQIVGVDARLFPGWQRVVPGDPQASLLYRKVARDGQPGDGMPLQSAPLDTALVSLLRRWIAAGALDD